jgi:phosphatidylserine/phosphatidylglycerophosphate/cardiolipin synthase-like enzyme
MSINHQIAAHFFSSLLWVFMATSAANALAGTEIPAAGHIEVAFSPNEGSEDLIVKVIDSSRSEVRVLAYSFTSAPITQALLRAKKRGALVVLVVDQKSNVNEEKSGKAQAALSALANAGCEVRTISAYTIHHDKTIIIDKETVETGSYNFSQAAAHRNSENVIVNWNNPKLAHVYLEHFERNYKQSKPFIPR